MFVQPRLTKVYTGFWQFLECCPDLTRLQLFAGAHSYDTKPEKQPRLGRVNLAMIPSAILPHVSSALRTLVIGFNFSYQPGSTVDAWVKSVDWPNLQSALLGFSRLEAVTLLQQDIAVMTPTRYVCCTLDKEHQKLIRGHLPHLSASGKLDFEGAVGTYDFELGADDWSGYLG